MKKIWLIIMREYLTRVKKKTFVLMTLLGPILMAGMFIGLLWFSFEEDEKQKVLVVDDKYPAFATLENNGFVDYDYGKYTLEDAKTKFYESDYTGILYIPENIEASSSAVLYFKKQPSAKVLRVIENKVENIVEELKLKSFNIDKNDFYQVKTEFNLNAVKYSETGEEEQVQNEKAIVGFAFAILIYLFIFLYGVQVMRGVIEEKTNRIVELIISSVKPFQLMAGKIIGVAMVGLTQFLMWVVLTGVLVTIGQSFFISSKYSGDNITQQVQMSTDMMDKMGGGQETQISNEKMMEIFNFIEQINLPLMIGMFLFYFIFGYLLYSSLFAAIGSAVDNETDSQQFMLPVTIPLIAAYMVSATIIQNPEGPAGFWFSIIPFTSPIVMLVRLPFGVPIWEILLSMVLLIGSFIGTIWLAGRIYRTGILMYGKKVNYKEVFRWLIYKH